MIEPWQLVIPTRHGRKRVVNALAHSQLSKAERGLYNALQAMFRDEFPRPPRWLALKVVTLLRERNGR